MSDERPDMPPVQLARVRASLEESARVKLETLAVSGARIAEAAELLFEQLECGLIQPIEDLDRLVRGMR